jgi:hypothetical protein
MSSAREVVTRAPHREVGIVNASWLLDHSVQHESHLERRFIMVALACPAVIDIHHQPKKYELKFSDGSEHTYTPDFEVRFGDGTRVVCEVKPRVFLEQSKEVLEAATRLFRDAGENYEIVTDHQVDGNGLGSRAILLMRYGRLHFSPEAALECKELLQQAAERPTVGALMEQGVSEDLIWNLVARHSLRAGPHLNLTREERVEINEPMENCLDYFRRWIGA